MTERLSNCSIKNYTSAKKNLFQAEKKFIRSMDCMFSTGRIKTYLINKNSFFSKIIVKKFRIKMLRKKFLIGIKFIIDHIKVSHLICDDYILVIRNFGIFLNF